MGLIYNILFSLKMIFLIQRKFQHRLFIFITNRLRFVNYHKLKKYISLILKKYKKRLILFWEIEDNYNNRLSFQVN